MKSHFGNSNPISKLIRDFNRAQDVYDFHLTRDAFKALLKKIVNLCFYKFLFFQFLFMFSSKFFFSKFFFSKCFKIDEVQYLDSPVS